jgi:hypothetical protein
MAPPAAAGGAPQRRILLAGLSQADARRLEVFLVVRSDRLRQQWHIVSEGPVDVYLHDADEPPTIPGSLERTPHQVRVMDERHAEPGDLSVLRRPLQYEAFIDILAAIEQQLPGPAMQVPASAAPAGPAAAAQLAPAPLAAAPLAASAGAMRFRLRRWPGASLLDSIHQGLRMASFITVRYLTVDELSSLSGVDREGCSTFLDTMMDNELLRAEPVQATGAAAPAAAPRAAAARPDRALLTSLRAKLGIRTEGR